MEELDIIKRVFLLAMSKREEGETMKDILESLVNTGMFDKGMKEAKETLEELRASNHVVGDNLTMVGVMVANEAEREFKQ
jgi:predicted double-glycine peptidase